MEWMCSKTTNILVVKYGESIGYELKRDKENSN